MSLNRFLSLFFLVLLISLSFQCKTKPKRKTLTIEKGPITEVPSDFSSTDSLISALAKSNVEFNWYSAKANVEVSTKKQKQNFSATIRIRKDSAIWLSITPALGIEAVRVLLTTDSVKFYNRINSEYFAGDYQIMKQTLKIEAGYSLVQSLILGNSYLHYPLDLYGSELENGYLMLNTRKKRQIKRNTELPVPEILFQEIFFNPALNKIARMYLQDYRPIRRFDVAYSEFQMIENKLLPHYINVKASADEDVEIWCELSKITLNKPLNLPFKIPDGYERKY